MTTIDRFDDPEWLNRISAELEEDWHVYEEDLVATDEEEGDYPDEDDDVDSLSDVYDLAFGQPSDHKLAREATRLRPRDFI